MDIKLLREQFNIQYVDKEIPCSRDHEIITLIESVGELSVLLRALKSKENEGEARTLLAFSERMASYSYRKKETKLLKVGMAACCISFILSDARECYQVFSLSYRTLKKLNYSPEVFDFDWLRKLDKKAKQFIDSFLSRSEDDKNIECMGYIESKDSSGFRYAYRSDMNQNDVLNLY